MYFWLHVSDDIITWCCVNQCRSGGSSNGSIGEEGGCISKAGDMVVEKRTRFSLSHDEGSIGNTSDNLEAVSEAASNHSVESSLDDVEQVNWMILKIF